MSAKGHTRAVYWSRGFQLPHWKNGLAHRVLEELLARDHEAEIAKVDYLAHALILLQPYTNEKIFKLRLESITRLRTAALEVLNWTSYDPKVKKKQAEETTQKAASDQEILKKVQSFSDDIPVE